MANIFNTSYIDSLINLGKFKISNKTNINVTTYGFLTTVYDLYRRILKIREYYFSESVLGASRDYYAFIKCTRNEVGSEKLQALLVNTQALVDHLRRSDDASSELVQLYIEEATIYINAVGAHFHKIEQERLSPRLVERMKESKLLGI